MLVSEFVNLIAAETGRDPRDIERYTRSLREADFFPERLGGRKVPIEIPAAAGLVLAVLAAENAARAADAYKAYAGLQATTQTIGGTLLEFIAMFLADAHSSKSLQKMAAQGTLSVLRNIPAAIWQQGPVGRQRQVTFHPSIPTDGKSYRGWSVEAHVMGPALVRLSFALADEVEPHH